MFAIDHSTAATSLPTPSTPGTPGWFTAGNPASNIPATVVTQDFLNIVQDELLNIVAADPGLSPSKTTRNQVLTAIEYLIAANGSGRTKLTANTPFYVDFTNGNDSNNGLAAGSGHAWKTLQKAINVLLMTYDLQNFVATINHTGTDTGGIQVGAPFTGGGQVQVTGAGSPTSTISTVSQTCVNVANGATLYIQGFKFVTTTAGNCLSSSGCGFLYQQGSVEFGACAQYHCYSHSGGFIALNANYAVSGSAQAHWLADANGNIQAGGVSTVTITGTPAFSLAWAVVDISGTIYAPGSMVFSGAATGSRYLATGSGCIKTNGASTSFFPGNASGSATTGVYE